MDISLNFHNPVLMLAREFKGTTWLHVEGKGGNYISIYMPLAVAERIAAAFTVENTVEPGRTDLDERFSIGGTTYIGGKPRLEADYTDANLSDFDDGNITP